MTNPIFVFSLPRSGSTLLQRVLMTHPDICSVAEPWILLPFLYSRKKKGVLAEFSQLGSKKAIDDFINNLPNKDEDYNKELGCFIKKLYEMQCSNGEVYFLDKTPRYHLIIPEIVELFPKAKFIFLFRNPIHVMTSIMETWCDGGFYGLFSYKIDLNRGVPNLANGYLKIKDKALAISYEELIQDSENTTKIICKYLDLNFDPNMLENFSRQKTKGRMGDPIGVKRYSKIEKDSLQKWKRVLNNRYRINVMKKYIISLNNEDLIIHGYDKNLLLEELAKLKPKRIISVKDWFYVLIGNFILKYKLNIFFGRETGKLTKNKYFS
ncbi:sulfotransferase family protein [Aestuariibaculum lutulentum]|uniref:Sulfotransferase n=1 Tax=Aestuariibaculum lutulentum TaxID=2920935 RepID=A0ABS9RIW6_9FLAO|nr:sulfotransferase [Aestuariibaculum lutulentum]MCH4552109.1 sulfotransferase [Aestuariibaculum lutulentum]